MRVRKPVKKKYSLAYLLARQPKPVQQAPECTTLKDYLRRDIPLQRLRFGRRCYSLLNRARIAPENLASFYRTYRLPRHPFFPLFLSLKKGYLQNLERKRNARREYILGRIRGLSALYLTYFKYFAEFERRHHPRQQYPLWSRRLWPHTKKQADNLQALSWTGWVERFQSQLDQLAAHYPNLNREHGKKIIALFILNLEPEKHPPDRIKTRYRQLSKQRHPDTGGSTREFQLLQWAREVMLPGVESLQPGKK